MTRGTARLGQLNIAKLLVAMVVGAIALGFGNTAADAQANTITNIRDFSDIGDECRTWDTSGSSSRWAIRRSNDGQWLQGVNLLSSSDPTPFGPQWKLLSGDQENRFQEPYNGTCGPFERIRLAPGQYHIGIRAYDGSGTEIGRVWHPFTVGERITLSNIRQDHPGNCLRWDTNGDSRWAIKRKSDGQWLQDVDSRYSFIPASFGPQWTQFDGVTGPRPADQAGTCAYYDIINLPAGEYFLGIRTYASDGSEGPRAWHSFTVSRTISIDNLIQRDGGCFTWETAGLSKWAIKRASDGQWLQQVGFVLNDDLAPFAPQWKNFSGEQTYRGEEALDGSCSGLKAIRLNPGQYYLGIRSYSLDGKPGPKVWHPFTVS